MNPILKKLLPHLGAVLVLLLVTVIYFSPMVFEGKVLRQSDVEQAKGMQGEIRKVKGETGTSPLWTNAMFSGMPTYQILMPNKSPVKPIFHTLLLGNYMSATWPIVFLLMLGFYLLLITLQIDWRIATIGALSFGLATNHIILVEAGHLTKLTASAYMAPILAGILLAFRKKYLLGGGLVALAVGLQVYANHVQITYYFFLLLLIFGLVYLIDAFQKKELPHFFKAVGILLVAVLLGVGANTARLWATYEYSQESIRGDSELNEKGQSSGASSDEGGGLSKDYAFYWSYGIGETFNLLVPAYRGGSSFKLLLNDEDSATRRYWSRSQEIRQLDPNTQNALASRFTAEYWGDQPFTSGPVYLGIILIFLFFMGAFLVQSPLKWWIVVGVALTIMLAWGKNFAALNYFIFDTLPLYNKFRAMTMILGITNFMAAVLAFMGLQQFFSKEIEAAKKRQALIYAGGITVGLLALAAIGAMGASYGLDKLAEINLPPAIANPLGDALEEDRAGLLWNDWMRSTLLAALTFGLLWLAQRGTLKPGITVLAVGGLLLFDYVGVDLRQLNSDNFQPKREADNYFEPTPADEQIMADPDLHYRVLDLRGADPFQNSLTSFHHKSIGGYHAAKLMRYQELIERYIGRGYTRENAPIYDMLNTKYVISQQGEPQQVGTALGNAWFVKDYQEVANGDEEIAALASLNPGEQAVIQQQYTEAWDGWHPQFDSTATIRLTKYHPDRMEYEYTAQSDQLAIFSEIYYPPSKGWKLFLDGEPFNDLIKANFLLRAARLPAGQNRKLEMRFEPQSYYLGSTISVICGTLAILFLVIGGVFYFRKNQLADPNQLEEAVVEAAPSTRVERRKKEGKSGPGSAAKHRKKKR